MKKCALRQPRQVADILGAMKTHHASASAAPRRAGQALPDVRPAATREELVKLVQQVLCTHDRLDAAVTPIATTLLVRSGKPCGMIFESRGPRQLTSSAIWA